MKIKNKKAMSNIIAAVILISLSLVATGIIGSMVLNLSEDILTSPANCIDFQLKNPIEIQSACYNKTSNETLIRIRRRTKNPEISQIRFILTNENNREEFLCSDKCENCQIPEKSSEKKYFLKTEIKPKQVTIYS